MAEVGNKMATCNGLRRVDRPQLRCVLANLAAYIESASSRDYKVIPWQGFKAARLIWQKTRHLRSNGVGTAASLPIMTGIPAPDVTGRRLG